MRKRQNSGQWGAAYRHFCVDRHPARREPRPTEAPPATTKDLRPARRRRIPTVDVVRGVLMTLIIATHALSNVDPERSGLGVTAFRMVLSGTVGFATLSGMLVGYFLIAKSGELK